MSAGGGTRGPNAGAFEHVVSQGGVVLFPSDTVYGLACDPSEGAAITRLYRLKGRAPEKAAAVMFFDFELALRALPPEIGGRTRLLLRALLPGPLTVLLPNAASRFPLACAGDPGTLGLRVVAVPELAGVRLAVLQSSANVAGGEDPARLADVESSILAGVDLVVDGGELPGLASTVLDLRDYERAGRWGIVREGPVRHDAISAAAAAAVTASGAGSLGDR